MEDYKVINNNKEWKDAISEGYTILLGIPDNTEVVDGLIACTQDNYKKVFNELTGFEYSDIDGTHGSAMPISETLGNDNLFECE